MLYLATSARLIAKVRDLMYKWDCTTFFYKLHFFGAASLLFTQRVVESMIRFGNERAE